MAVIKAGSLIADIRGKVGTNVFSRGQGGATVRDVGSWVQPDNEAQQSVRDTIEALSQAWSSTLTAADRKTWRSYAKTNPRPDQWGTRNLTNGYSAFVRHNFHSYQDTSVLQFNDAPTSNPIHPPAITLKVQQKAAIIIVGAISPAVDGTYIPDGQYDNHPCWRCTATTWEIWWSSSDLAWELSPGRGNLETQWWFTDTLDEGTWYPSYGEEGGPVGTWSYDASLVKITTPPVNYTPPPAGLTLYLYSGIPLAAGREYYSGPYLKLITLPPAIAAVAATTWQRWTWPTRSVEPPWTWPPDGSGSARAYAIAQDDVTGSISTKHILTPTFGSLTPW